MAAGPVGSGQGGGQVGHFAGAHAAGLGAAAPTARRGGAADRGGGHPRRLVSGHGAWSAWTAARWMSPTRRPTRRPSVGPGASRGSSAYPQIRFVALVENGTHVLFGSQMAGYGTGEITLAKAVLGACGRACCAWPTGNFFGFELWSQAAGTGADLLWRIKKNLRLPCEKRLPDGSYLSRIYPSEKDRRHQTNGVQVRVIEYRLEGVADAEPIYRLVTTILDPAQAPGRTNWRPSITSAGRSKPRWTN